MVELFEYASRKKLRFGTRIGNLTTEDLWDLPLTFENDGISLDYIEKGLNKALKNSADEESYVVKQTVENTDAKVSLGIVRRVIDYKIDVAARVEKAAATKAKKEQILEILHEKKVGALKDMDKVTLEKMLEDM